MKHTKMILVGGWAMVLFAILFVGITIVIDNLVQSQTMLYNLEQHQLFKVSAGTPAVRFLLTCYALLPLLLIPGSVGLYYTCVDQHEAQMRVGMYFATAGALALSISLLMLPSINWHLVSYIPTLPGNEQNSMIILLQSFHTYFGMFIGDILGLTCILIWFFITSLVIIRSNALPHPVGMGLLIITICAALVLILRYTGLVPAIHVNIQVAGIIALWMFICGISLISFHK